MFYFVVCLFFLILCLKFRYVEYLLLVQLFSSHGGGGGAKDTRVSEHLKDGNDQSDEQLIPGQVINLRTIRSFPHKQLCTHSSLPGCMCVVSPRWGSITKKMSIHISGSDATWSRPPPACPEGRTGNYFVCWFTIMKMRTIRGRGWEKKKRRREESSQCATPCCLLLLVRLIVTWS